MGSLVARVHTARVVTHPATPKRNITEEGTRAISDFEYAMVGRVTQQTSHCSIGYAEKSGGGAVPRARRQHDELGWLLELSTVRVEGLLT
jgi:hypothetical protein